MKKAMFFGMALLGASLMVLPAEAAEKLYICRSCSREFLPQAQEVLADLGLEDEVSITPSSCMGPCNADYVVGFQGSIYPYMNADTLRQMLISVYSLEDTKAP